jgi:methylmalonyl-CoA mutase
MQDAFARTVLGLSVDGEYFSGIAKLRAARALWARLTAACGVNVPARIEARSSRRMLSKLDPWVNLLRLTAAGFAAATGGADAVVLEPFTRPLGHPTPFARRQARNTQLVLMEEAHLGEVADPAGGAWFLETRTDDLARVAWTVFQGIEREGGIVAALESGVLAGRIAEVRKARFTDVMKRKAGLVGASEFPHLDEAAVATEAVDLSDLTGSADVRLPGPDGRCEALTPVRLSEPFEALRERALQLSASPKVFLATLGTASDFTARATFARNLFAAGGIAAVVDAADRYDPSIAPFVVLCSSDERYAEEAVPAVRLLKQTGAKAVWVAGRPGEHEAELKAAGVDDYIYAGGDAVATLSRALELEDRR